MPCWSGHTPQQIEALLVLVTEGIVSFTLRKKPACRQRASTGIGLCSRYSRPKPSTITTMTRCGVRLAKIVGPNSAAVLPRSRRRVTRGEEGILTSSILINYYTTLSDAAAAPARQRDAMARAAPRSNFFATVVPGDSRVFLACQNNGRRAHVPTRTKSHGAPRKPRASPSQQPILPFG